MFLEQGPTPKRTSYLPSPSKFILKSCSSLTEFSPYIYIYIPGTCLSSILNPPKEGPFRSKQGSFGFQVHIFYFSLKQMHPQKLGPKIFENFSLHVPPRTVDGSLKSGDHQLRLLVVHLPVFTRVFRHPRWFEIAGFRNEPSTGLVGGFNPFEKDYCIGNLPQIGVKIKNI